MTTIVEGAGLRAGTTPAGLLDATTSTAILVSTVDTVEGEVLDARPSNARAMVDGLLNLAAMIEANPELVDGDTDNGRPPVRYSLDGINIPVRTRAAVAALARAGVNAGAAVTKHQGDTWAGVDISFTPPGTSHVAAVRLHVYVDREEICERIVTGTRTVTEDVPDPDALAAVPTVTVTKTVEDVEWRCGSILRELDGPR